MSRTASIPATIMIQPLTTTLVSTPGYIDSGIVRESDPPRQVSVSVEGAEELRLVAGDAGDGQADTVIVPPAASVAPWQ